MADSPLSIPSISTEGWNIDKVLNHGKNFVLIERIPANSPDGLNFEEIIKGHEESGIPLIVEGWHKRNDWPKSLFTLDFFQENSPEDIHVRNVHNWKDEEMLLAEFIAASRANPPCAPPGEKVRYYGKDAECPKDWSTWIKKGGAIPECLHWNGSNDYFRYRPKNAPVQTLMCYAGIGDTFTPAHKDLCASSGHNLMCVTEHNGSSYWFMTKSSDAAKASDFFQSLRQELDHEAHVISLDELAKAPFEIYIAEQVLGDLVLVPPRSCHQVVNFGGITLKTSWSRMTLEGLITAYYHELPIYQRVCRAETYRVKSTIFCAIRNQIKELERLSPSHGRSMRKGRFSGKPNSKSLALIQSLQRLATVFREIVAQEYGESEYPCLAPTIGELNDEQTMENRIVCDFCGGDIFQSFFECNSCLGVKEENGDADAYTICPACYIDGRSCRCLTMHPRQCFPHQELRRVVKQADKILEDFDSDWKNTREVLNADYPVFKAACKLLQHRTAKYTCIFDKEVTYGLNCKWKQGCHHARCFGHLLEKNRIHAVEAVHLYYNESHTKYHQAHIAGRQKYNDSLKAMAESQEAGSKGPIDMLRVHYALKYRSCRPWASGRSNAGFYDAYIQGCIESDDEDQTPSSSRSVSPESPAYRPRGTSTRNPNSSAVSRIAPQVKSLNTVPSTSRSVRSPASAEDETPTAFAVVFDCVDVPRAPYPTENVPCFSTRAPDVKIGPPRKKQRRTVDKLPTEREVPERASEGVIHEVVELSDQGLAPAILIDINRDSDDPMDSISPLRPNPSTMPVPSSSSKRHKFRSGMVVTLTNDCSVPMEGVLPFVDGQSPSPPPSPTLPQSITGPKLPSKKRKQHDLAISLADAMNQANAQNSKVEDAPPPKRSRPTQYAELPSRKSKDPAPALLSATALEPTSRQPAVLEARFQMLIQTGSIEPRTRQELIAAAKEVSSSDENVKAAAETKIRTIMARCLAITAGTQSVALPQGSGAHLQGIANLPSNPEIDPHPFLKPSVPLPSRSPPTEKTQSPSEPINREPSDGVLDVHSSSGRVANAEAGPSTQADLPSPPLPRCRSPPNTQSRPRDSTQKRISSASSRSRAPHFLQSDKGKGKSKGQERETEARAGTRPSRSSSMKDDKEVSPKTMERMFSTLADAVKWTRIPKFRYDPGEGEFDGKATSSASTGSMMWDMGEPSASSAPVDVRWASGRGEGFPPSHAGPLQFIPNSQLLPPNSSTDGAMPQEEDDGSRPRLGI